MSIGEVAYRLWLETRNLPTRFGIDRTRSRANRQIESSIHNWIHGGAGVDSDQARKSGEDILAGKFPVLSLDSIGIAWPPEWNTDPVSGIRCPLSYGKKIDYRDAAVVGNIKYVWELNRHLEFPQLAQAYCVTGDQRFLDGLTEAWLTWLDDCPFPRGVNWNSSLELGIRLINWATAVCILDRCDSPLSECNPMLNEKVLVSVYEHQSFIAKNLSRYSSANNHLIGEAAGLYVASATWTFWHESASWNEKSTNILIEQCELQIADDGAGLEQAIAYLYFVLEFYLIAAVVGRVMPEQFPQRTWRRLERAIEFGSAMHDISGNCVNFGDADDAVVLRFIGEERISHRQIVEQLFAGLRETLADDSTSGSFGLRTRLFLSNRSGVRKDQFEPDTDSHVTNFANSLCRTFQEGGYFILGEQLGQRSEIRCTVDCGFLGFKSIAAHGHADALSFVLSVAGVQILVDPGTYAYHTDGRWRSYFRGTKAHNTIVVDGFDQSEIGGPFMWTKHANAEHKVWKENSFGQVFSGTHDGYLRLDDPVRHSREIRYTNGKQVFEIQDVLECNDHHIVDQFWHFHPDCEVKANGAGCMEIRSGGVRVRSIDLIDELESLKQAGGASVDEKINVYGALAATD